MIIQEKHINEIELFPQLDINRFTLIVVILIPIIDKEQLQEFYLGTTRAIKDFIGVSRKEVREQEKINGKLWLQKKLDQALDKLEVDKKGEIFKIDKKRIKNIKILDANEEIKKLYKQIKIKVKDLQSIITFTTLQQDIFDVDFDGTLIQITNDKKTDTYKVTNAVNGYGINCKSEYENEKVIFE